MGDPGPRGATGAQGVTGAKGEKGETGSAGPPGGESAPDPLKGFWALMVDGGFAAPVRGVEGCGIAAPLVKEKVAPDGIQRKHIAGVFPGSCLVALGLAMEPALADWLAGAFANSFLRHQVTLVRTDAPGAQGAPPRRHVDRCRDRAGARAIRTWRPVPANRPAARAGHSDRFARTARRERSGVAPDRPVVGRPPARRRAAGARENQRAPHGGRGRRHRRAPAGGATPMSATSTCGCQRVSRRRLPRSTRS